MRKVCVGIGVIAAALVGMACLGAIRGPGKYTGVVVFDRWGGCTLNDGPYLMYVAEGVKEQLRKRAGQCVEIDATDVYQPMNPGDGLIKAFTVVGTGPAGSGGESPTGLKLSIRPTFRDGEKPTMEVRVENVSAATVKVNMESLAPTVLARKSGTYWGPSDGPSTAVITRNSFWAAGPRTEGGNDTLGWRVGKAASSEPFVELASKGALTIEISLRLPAGEYDFLAGYGGDVQNRQCIASNLIGFDVGKEGTATVVKVAGR
jgi:hypothetical protein